MLEARFILKYEDIIKNYYKIKDFGISLDHVLKCSVYNQACDGGYSYLVSKFLNQFQVITKNCFNANKVTSNQKGEGCQQECKNTKQRKLKLFVDDYYYVGGAYGLTNEENIMREVRVNGPIVISIEPDVGFMSYKSGIYDPKAATWLLNKVASKPEWTKVDHSVVLVGWGVENKEKYWLLQNSWGASWGENGYIRVKRGEDQIGVESIGEAAIVRLEEL